MKKFLKWLDNYWYHYKWHTIITVFFVTVAVICTFQMVTKDSYDVYAMYSGGQYFTADRQHALEEAFTFVIDDYNSDGEKLVCLKKIVVLSEEELKEKKAEAKAEDDSLAYSVENRTAAIEQLGMEIMTGQSYLCFLSEGMYDQVKDKGRFIALADVFETVPEGAVDDYAIRLSETEFGKYFKDATTVMGEDTVVCLRNITVQDASSERKTEEYNYHIDFFKKLVEFKVK